MIFEGAQDFVEFLRNRSKLLSILPWGNDLIVYSDSIEKGCKCKRKARESHTNAVYKDLVLNTVQKNKDIQFFLKKEANQDHIIFKLENEMIAEI